MVDYIREGGLIFYGVLTILLFIFGSDLLIKYLRADKYVRNDAAYKVFYVIGTAVAGYGVYMLIALLNYFYSLEVEAAVQFNILVQIQIVVTMILLSSIATTCENLIFKKQHLLHIGKLQVGLIGLGSYIIILYMLLLIVLGFVNPALIPIISPYTSYVIIASFTIYGIIDFLEICTIFFIRLKPQKEIRKKIVLGLLWGVLAAIGSAVGAIGRMDWNIWFPLGTAIECIGWIFFRHAFLSIPSYGEMEWRTGLIEIHVIMAEVGLSLYNRKFMNIDPNEMKGDLKIEMTIKEEDRPNSDLVGGGMIGIKGMLGEIAGTKGKLQNIQIGDKHLLFNQGKTLLILLLCKQNLGVYHGILFNLVKEIEDAHPELADFKGNVESLKLATYIDKYFGAEEPKKAKK